MEDGIKFRGPPYRHAHKNLSGGVGVGAPCAQRSSTCVGASVVGASVVGAEVGASVCDAGIVGEVVGIIVGAVVGIIVGAVVGADVGAKAGSVRVGSGVGSDISLYVVQLGGNHSTVAFLLHTHVYFHSFGVSTQVPPFLHGCSYLQREHGRRSASCASHESCNLAFKNMSVGLSMGSCSCSN